jgi:hypothetical protein
MPNVEVE